MDTLISLCTPVMNRLDDLRRAMPYRIEAAAACPPVEFAILDYGSNDGLADYIQSLSLPSGIVLTYRRYSKRPYYHVAHAWNLSILMSGGEYFAVMGADTYPKMGYFGWVRSAILGGCVWLEPEKLRGAIVCRKAEWEAAGGYDERFELYGPEDRELANRLTLRGGKMGTIPRGLMGRFHTPDEKKTANYRIKADKHTLSEMMRQYYWQSVRDGITVANAGEEWGQWT